MITPSAKTEVMILQLAKVGTQVAPRVAAVVACHNAGWPQRGSELHVPPSISLLSLPLYSPELNRMANIWDYLRQNKLCMLAWHSGDEIVNACATAWRWLVEDPERLEPTGPHGWAVCSVIAIWYNI